MNELFRQQQLVIEEMLLETPAVGLTGLGKLANLLWRAR